jgi:plasmid stability protein
LKDLLSATLMSLIAVIALESQMASITIRNLDDALKARLRVEAANNNCSMEEQARVILRAALNGKQGRKGLGSSISDRFARHNIELDLPSRSEKPRVVDLKE